MMLRRLVVLVVLIVVLSAIGTGINTLLYGSVKITVTGSHNPVSTFVEYGEERLFPQGEGGRDYVLRKRQGEHTLVISGPDIMRAEIVVSTQMLKSQAREITIEKRDTSSIVGNVIKPAQGSSVGMTRYFGRNDWLVVRIEDQNPITDSVLHVLTYSYDDDTWVSLVSGIKIVTNAPNLSDAPRELVEYLNSVGGD